MVLQIKSAMFIFLWSQNGTYCIMRWGGAGGMEVLCKVRKKVGIRKLRAWAHLVPLLAEALAGWKWFMLGISELLTSVSMDRNISFPNISSLGSCAYWVWQLVKNLVSMDLVLNLPLDTSRGEWHLFLGFMCLLLIMLLTCCFLWVLNVQRAVQGFSKAALLFYETET